MRKLPLLALLVGGAVLAAPTAWSSIIQHGSVGSVSIEVHVSSATVNAGGSGHADILIENHSATETVELRYTGMLYFSNGSHARLNFIPRRIRLNPQEGLLTSVTFAVPGWAPSGPAKLLSGFQVLSIEEGGQTTIPSEPTGAWHADSFTVR